MATLDLTSLGLERQRRLEELSKLYLGGETESLPPIESFMQIDQFGRTPAQAEQARKSALGVEQSILNLQSQTPPPQTQRQLGPIERLIENDPTGTLRATRNIGEGIASVGTGIIGGTIGAAGFISDAFWGNVDTFMRTGSLSAPALEQVKGKNFYRDSLKKMQETASALQLQPESETGKKVVDLAMLIPNAIKTATDFTAQQAGRVGLSEDQQALLSFTLEALALYGADRGFRAAANKYKSTFAKAKTEFDNFGFEGSDQGQQQRRQRRESDPFNLKDPEAWQKFQDLKAKFGLDPSLDQEFQNARKRTYGSNSQSSQTGANDINVGRPSQQQTGEQRLIGSPEVSPTEPPTAKRNILDIAADEAEMQAIIDANKGKSREEIQQLLNEWAVRKSSQGTTPTEPTVNPNSVTGLDNMDAGRGALAAMYDRMWEDLQSGKVPDLNSLSGQGIKAAKDRGFINSREEMVEVAKTIEANIDQARREGNDPVQTLRNTLESLQKPVQEVVPSSPQSTLTPEQQTVIRGEAAKSLRRGTIVPLDNVARLVNQDVQNGLTIRQSLTLAGVPENQIAEVEAKLAQKTSFIQRENVQEAPNLNQNTRDNLSQIIDIALNPNTPKDQQLAALQQIKSSLRENQPPRKSIDKIVDELGITLTPEQRQELLPQLRTVRTPKTGPIQNKRFAAPQEFQEPLSRIAQEEGVDKSILEALISHESNWNPTAVSKAGAQGLGQIMPGTQKEVGVTKPFDPENNMRGAAKYLRRMLVEFNGNLELALAAYNAGPGRVKNAGNKIPEIAETQNYVTDIKMRIASLTGKKFIPTDTELFDRTSGVIKPEVERPIASLPIEIDPTTITQPIVSKVQSALKDSDPSVPLELSGNEKATFIHENTKPVGPIVLDEIAKALEGKIDISDRLPENVRPHFQRLLEEQTKSLSSSEGRGFLQILSDAMDLILPDDRTPQLRNSPLNRGMANEQGAIGRFGLTYKQRKAAQNLLQDARRAGKGIEEFLRNLGKTPEETKIISLYLDSTNNPMPEDGVNPRNMRLDPLMTTDKIVKQRKEQNKTFVPVYGSESLAIQTAKDIRSTNWKQSTGDFLKNPLYILRTAGLMDEIYYPYRTMERRLGREQQEMVGDIAKMKRVVNSESEKAIWAYGYSQDPDGRKLNTFANVTPRQLTPGEMEVYNTIRHVYDEYFLRINEVRRATGREELDPVPNYFTLSRAFSAMERKGLQPNLLLDSKSSINDRFAEHMHTRFPYTIRTKAAYVPDYNGFNVLQAYLTSALRDIHRSPFIAKVHELIDTELPDINNPNRKFNLEKSNQGLHDFLQSWNNFLAGRPNFSLAQMFPSNGKARFAEKAIDRIRYNLGVSVLTGTFSTIINQTASLPKIYHAVGPVNATKAIASVMSDSLTGLNLNKSDWKESEVIDTRAMEASLADIQNTVRDFSIGKGIQSAATFGFSGMRAMDMVMVLIARRAGTIRAKELNLVGRDANRFADDIIVRTQGSAMPGDLNTWQHSSVGKLATLFQSYAISDWNYLMHEVVNVRGESQAKRIGAAGWLTFIIATAALNTFYEDFLGLNSVLPTPLRSLKKALETSINNNEDNFELAGRVAVSLTGSALENVPPLSSIKYGTGLGGPLIAKTFEIGRGFAGNQKAEYLLEPAAEIAGLPFANFVFKTRKALKRGQSVPSSLLGIQQENLEEGINSRLTNRGRSVGSRGR